ncbi:ribosomal-processing cysteine protease Prp [Clostridium sediminicola]|uniref:ribosomal-processing cysteine protease Prp n=1 Tax=Clostridium sediminicola TaxID=3114879 RepID=UPI0031F25B6B
MTNVLFKKRNDRIISYTASGHTEYSEEGYDIICSAISAMSYTTLNGLIDVLHMELIQNQDFFIEEETGYLSINLENRSVEDIEKSQVLLETLLLGFKSMKSYEKYINVIVEEV